MQIKTGTDFFKTRDVYQKVQGIFEIINKKLDLFAKSKKINPISKNLNTTIKSFTMLPMLKVLMLLRIKDLMRRY